MFFLKDTAGNNTNGGFCAIRPQKPFESVQAAPVPVLPDGDPAPPYSYHPCLHPTFQYAFINYTSDSQFVLTLRHWVTDFARVYAHEGTVIVGGDGVAANQTTWPLLVGTEELWWLKSEWAHIADYSPIAQP